MPTYSKAISNELNELFSTVEKQALEYAQAFSYISAKIAEFDSKMANLDSFREEYTNNIAMLTNETRQTVSSLSEDLRSQLDLVVRLNTEYVQIVEFKESLIAMYNKMRYIINQNELNQREFKNRIELETQKFINTCKVKSDKALEESIDAIDEKIATLGKEISAKLATANEQISATLIEMINDISYIKETISKQGKDIEVLQEHDSEEVELFESKEDTGIEKEITLLKEENKKLQERIDELHAREKLINELESKLSSLSVPKKEEKKQRNALAITGLIIAIIALALSLLL